MLGNAKWSFNGYYFQAVLLCGSEHSKHFLAEVSMALMITQVCGWQANVH